MLRSSGGIPFGGGGIRNSDLPEDAEDRNFEIAEKSNIFIENYKIFVKNDQTRYI